MTNVRGTRRTIAATLGVAAGTGPEMGGDSPDLEVMLGAYANGRADERAAVVKWLRARNISWPEYEATDDDMGALEYAAAAVERGEHDDG